MIEEFSAGIIVIDFEHKKVFLIQHIHGEHWGFPKGHIEPGEKPLFAAKRELYEESGLKVTQRLLEQEFEESYQFQKDDLVITKRVTYFVYRTKQTDFHIQEDEILNAGWFSIDDALKQLTFDQSQSILTKIATLLEKELEL